MKNKHNCQAGLEGPYLSLGVERITVIVIKMTLLGATAITVVNIEMITGVSAVRLTYQRMYKSTSHNYQLTPIKL